MFFPIMSSAFFTFQKFEKNAREARMIKPFSSITRICSSDEVKIAFKSEFRLLVIISEEHTSELQSRGHLVCRLLLEKKIYYVCLKKKFHQVQLSNVALALTDCWAYPSNNQVTIWLLWLLKPSL